MASPAHRTAANPLSTSPRGMGLRCLGTTLLATGWTLLSAAQAQTFSSVVVFGDSLSDPGNAAAGQNVNEQLNLIPELQYPGGTNLSTNPDWVWTQHVEKFFGGSGEYQPFVTGGTNYATAGACVRAEGCETYDEPLSIQAQMMEHLGGDGRADPDALYLLWGGPNDLNLLGPSGYLTTVRNALVDVQISGSDPTGSIVNLTNYLDNELSDVSGRAALDYVERIEFLQDQGAENIVILNMPNIGATPGVLFLDAALDRIDPNLPDISTLINRNGSVVFNETLADELDRLDNGIIAIDAYGFLEEIRENPAAYGFENITQAACRPNPAASSGFSRLPLNDACGPADDEYEYPYTYQEGTNTTHLFADNVHPSGATNKIMAELVISTISAPAQISLAGEGALALTKLHQSLVDREGAIQVQDPESRWRLWSGGSWAWVDQDAVPNQETHASDLQMGTLGLTYEAKPGLSLGTAISFGEHQTTVGGVTLDSASTIWSVDGTWSRGPLQLSGDMSWGQTDMDIDRSILGVGIHHVERGSTAVQQVGASLEMGYGLPAPSQVEHSLFGGVNWISQTVDAYREVGNSAAGMNFDEFDRTSLIVRGGYGLAWTRHAIQPYLQIAYERELETDPVRVSAGTNRMPGATFSVDGLEPTVGTMVVGLGATAALGSSLDAHLDYTIRTGTNLLSAQQVQLDLGWSF